VHLHLHHQVSLVRLRRLVCLHLRLGCLHLRLGFRLDHLQRRDKGRRVGVDGGLYFTRRI
jgi:hypothetical protein